MRVCAEGAKRLKGYLGAFVGLLEGLWDALRSLLEGLEGPWSLLESFWEVWMIQRVVSW